MIKIDSSALDLGHILKSTVIWASGVAQWIKELPAHSDKGVSMDGTPILLCNAFFKLFLLFLYF